MRTMMLAAVMILAVCVIGCNRPSASAAKKYTGKGGSAKDVEAGPAEQELFSAMRTGNLEALRQSFQQKPNLNAGEHGRAAIHIFAQSPWMGSTRSEVFEMLKARGADVNLRNEIGQSVLYDAHSADDVKMFLAAGADPLATDELGNTPLFHAPDESTVELLVKAGTNVNAVSKMGTTALHEAAADGNLPVVKALVSHGANVNARDGGSETPLQKANLSFRKDVAAYLQSKGGQ